MTLTDTSFLLGAARRFSIHEQTNGVTLMRNAGLEPDPWQEEFLRVRPDRALLLCSRQAAKSPVTAAAALEQALSSPRSTVLLISPSQRQSAELLAQVRQLALAQEPPVVLTALSVLSLRLANGSRVVSLPGKAQVIRGYTADLIVADEASWIPDELYGAVRPMLAVSGGRLVALSTPYGRRGWFHEAWASTEPWHRTRVTADQVPRITAEFLEEEARSLPTAVFAAEYNCEFTDRDDSCFA